MTVFRIHRYGDYARGYIIAVLDLPRGVPSKRESSACVNYVPALCTYRQELLLIESSTADVQQNLQIALLRVLGLVGIL